MRDTFAYHDFLEVHLSQDIVHRVCKVWMYLLEDIHVHGPGSILSEDGKLPRAESICHLEI